jgi:hypothetical protein
MTSDNLLSVADLHKRAIARSISPEEFEKELWRLCTGHHRRGRIYQAGTVRIYRTRVWPGVDRPKSVADISYPPKHASRLNRANAEGEQVFYASAGLPPSFVECRLEQGQNVVCGEWRNTATMILQEVGISNAGDPNHYIKTQCLAFPGLNKWGNLGRNTLIGPGVSKLDVSVFKNNRIRRISENFNAQFRAEFFNVLNRANFASPTDNSTVFDQNGNPISSAGLITSTQTTSRQIQFALKFIW